MSMQAFFFRLKRRDIGRLAGVAIALGMAAMVGLFPEVILAQATQARTGAANTKRPATQTKRSARPATTTRRATRPPVVPALRFTSPRGEAALAGDLADLLNGKTRNGKWGAMVVSISRGDTLFSHSPGEAMVPASTMKLFTSALAFEELGPDHVFSTDVLRSGPVDSGGVLRGDLIIRGDADPSLSARYYGGDRSGPMHQLATFVAATGIREVRGNIIADASALEMSRIPEGWLSRYAGAAYAAPFSALSLNDNVVVVGVTPGAVGGTTRVFLEPAVSTLVVTNTVRTVAGRGSRITARRVGDDRVVVSGTIGANAGTVRYQLVVGDPAMFTAGAFGAALNKVGVKVSGVTRPGRTPTGAEIVASLPSQPLARLVSVMNRESINLYAELLYRSAARMADSSRVGSAEGASRTLNEFLVSQVGVAPGKVVATDGSGLSVLDRVTPRSLIKLLDHAHNAPWGSAFHASLPVAGESELLRNRMRATPAQGNLHAKTGTTNEVIGLAGYVTAENGEILAFAFLYNGVDRWNARETIDAMGPTLAAFSRD